MPWSTELEYEKEQVRQGTVVAFRLGHSNINFWLQTAFTVERLESSTTLFGRQAQVTLLRLRVSKGSDHLLSDGLHHAGARPSPATVLRSPISPLVVNRRIAVLCKLVGSLSRSFRGVPSHVTWMCTLTGFSSSFLGISFGMDTPCDNARLTNCSLERMPNPKRRAFLRDYCAYLDRYKSQIPNLLEPRVVTSD
ncbi:hypothetical protein EVAR_78286_1 [Eumeta japonica]|uniref:Uncharacterized protein n=1 Tax=Eumeta variegata TaxID=151549 RepID=A0A4C1T3X3_EUMVA|nr:hypothetical protein EVAR_78286_1 [Eumeta japonica]